MPKPSYPRRPTIWQHIHDFIIAQDLQEIDGGKFYVATSQSLLILHETIFDQSPEMIIMGTPVYWIEGSAEGFYVHVCRQMRRPHDKHSVIEDVLLCKFMDVNRAERAATAIQRYINGYWEFLPEEHYYLFVGVEFRGTLTIRQALEIWAKERPDEPMLLYDRLKTNDDGLLPSPIGMIEEGEFKSLPAGGTDDGTKRIGGTPSQDAA